MTTHSNRTAIYLHICISHSVMQHQCLCIIMWISRGLMDYSNEFDYTIYKKTWTKLWEKPNFYSLHPKYAHFFKEKNPPIKVEMKSLQSGTHKQWNPSNFFEANVLSLLLLDKLCLLSLTQCRFILIPNVPLHVCNMFWPVLRKSSGISIQKSYTWSYNKIWEAHWLQSLCF